MRTSYSGVGQDVWVADTLGKKRDGLFLDVGCFDPFEGNNTWLLESQYGWSGISIDRNDTLALKWVRSERKTPFMCADVHLIDWGKTAWALSHYFDYLSLDVDDYQLEFVEKFPWNIVRFGAMTVEHDSYRFGNKPRDAIRSILESHGYQIKVRDVTCELGPCEDWWISPRTAPVLVL